MADIKAKSTTIAIAIVRIFNAEISRFCLNMWIIL